MEPATDDHDLRREEQLPEGWIEAEDGLKLLIDRCEGLSIELRNGVRAVARSVKSEIRWGGLIFNPDDIMKQLGKLNDIVAHVAQEGVGIHGQVLQLKTSLIGMASGHQLLDRNEALFSQVDEPLSSLTTQVQAVGDFVQDFYSALCNAGAARQLLPFFPSFAWEKDEAEWEPTWEDELEINEGDDEPRKRSLLDRLLGR